MLENRFLQSFCAVAASFVLVCGTLILLTSTAPWSPAMRIDSEPSTPDSARVSPEATASIDVEVPQAPLASDQADTPEVPSPPADDAVAALGTPLDPETADADSDDSGADASIVVQAVAASEGGAASDAPAEAAVSVPLAEIADWKRDAATDQIAEMLSALPPRPITSDKSDAATTQVATMLAAEPPAPVPPPASDAADAATKKVAQVLGASPPAPLPETATAAPVAVATAEVPPPPLPLRKPAEPQVEPKQAARPAEPQAAPVKQEAAKQDVAQPETAQPRTGSGPWQAMSLAPADKPALKVPTARPSGTAYAATVWSALARHKPKAGQRGSTTVVFAIGDNGALRAVRVGRSSGNSRLDQLALATVRNAAPYPPPPSGAASYTIRIDFQ